MPQTILPANPALEVFTFSFAIPGENASATQTAAAFRLLLTNTKSLRESLDVEIFNFAAHIADTTAAHAAASIEFTAVGSIAAVTVQAAIAELESEKASTGSVTVVDARLNNGGDVDGRIDALEAASVSNIGTGVSRRTVNGGTLVPPGSGSTLVTFTQEPLDAGYTDAGYWSVGTPERFVAPAAGRYLFTYTSTWYGTYSGTYGVGPTAFKGGVPVSLTPGQSGRITDSFTCVVALAAGEYVYLVASHAGGVNMNVEVLASLNRVR